MSPMTPHLDPPLALGDVPTCFYWLSQLQLHCNYLQINNGIIVLISWQRMIDIKENTKNTLTMFNRYFA